MKIILTDQDLNPSLTPDELNPSRLTIRDFKPYNGGFRNCFLKAETVVYEGTYFSKTLKQRYQNSEILNPKQGQSYRVKFNNGKLERGDLWLASCTSSSYHFIEDKGAEQHNFYVTQDEILNGDVIILEK